MASSASVDSLEAQGCSIHEVGVEPADGRYLAVEWDAGSATGEGQVQILDFVGR